jgi:hypothetical protein
MVRLPRSLASHEMGYVCACVSQRQSIALCTFPFPKSEIIEVFPQQPAWLPVSVTRGETDQGRTAAATHLQHRRQDVSGHCQVIRCNDVCRQWVLSYDRALETSDLQRIPTIRPLCHAGRGVDNAPQVSRWFGQLERRNTS